MGNRRLGTKRLESVLDNMLSHSTLNGLNGSPFSIRNPDRIYLEEFFKRRPSLNADLTNATEATRMVANPDWELLGSSGGGAVATGDATFDGPTGLLKLNLDATDQDAVTLFPHQDSNQSKWAVAGMWGSENQVEFECLIRTGDNIATQTIFAGLKLADDSGNNYAYATDSDQVCFWYSTDDTEGAFTTNANLHCIVSSGGDDYISDLGIELASDTNYRLGITFDAQRRPSAWVNGVQYSLTSATTAGGVTTGVGTVKGPALADDKDLFPTAGIVARDAAARHMYVGYFKCSRIVFE